MDNKNLNTLFLYELKSESSPWLFKENITAYILPELPDAFLADELNNSINIFSKLFTNEELAKLFQNYGFDHFAENNNLIEFDIRSAHIVLIRESELMYVDLNKFCPRDVTTKFFVIPSPSVHVGATELLFSEHHIPSYYVKTGITLSHTANIIELMNDRKRLSNVSHPSVNIHNSTELFYNWTVQTFVAFAISNC